MDTQQLAHTLGVATGRREVAERLAAELRRQAAGWRASEAYAGSLFGAVRAAALWTVTERWAARLEQVAAQVEGELATLRTAELGARAQYEQAARAPAPPPAKRSWWRRGS